MLSGLQTAGNEMMHQSELRLLNRIKKLLSPYLNPGEVCQKRNLLFLKFTDIAIFSLKTEIMLIAKIESGNKPVAEADACG